MVFQKFFGSKFVQFPDRPERQRLSYLRSYFDTSVSGCLPGCLNTEYKRWSMEVMEMIRTWIITIDFNFSTRMHRNRSEKQSGK